MAKGRKTIEVNTVRTRVNAMLANPKVTEEERRGMCLVLEFMLYNTNNYNGFNYVDWLNGGCDRWRADGSPSDNSSYLGPEYKRYYY